MFAHQPVLLTEVVDHLRPRAGVTLLDCTLGLGGHSQALLEAGATVVGVDRDAAARAAAQTRLQGFGARFRVLADTFAGAAAALVASGEQFDGVLADLGVSSMQLDDESRGFSIRSKARADMRMGDGSVGDAIDLISETDEAELADIIYRYGEERLSRRIAATLKRGVAEGRIVTGAELAEAVRKVVPGRHQRHPALRTFQALRIAVNNELDELERLLALLPALLKPGGRVAIMSFHSLEDRLVKQDFRARCNVGEYAEVARRPVLPTDAEQAANPRAASAKMRWAQMSRVTDTAPLSVDTASLSVDTASLSVDTAPLAAETVTPVSALRSPHFARDIA